ncbi:hypothetical protein BJX99DRAFT_259056 [Aspergillus californicus]
MSSQGRVSLCVLEASDFQRPLVVSQIIDIITHFSDSDPWLANCVTPHLVFYIFSIDPQILHQLQVQLQSQQPLQLHTTLHYDCIIKFEALKWKVYKYVIFKFSDNNTEIVVSKTGTSTDYSDFVKELGESEYAWAVYDFDYKIDNDDRSKIIFYYWLPETATIRKKLLFTASEANLREKLAGIHAMINATELSDIERDKVTALEKLRLR